MMNDNEIVKALECCSEKDCKKCPAFDENIECGENTIKLALDLINRQKTQIEGLQDEVVTKTDMLNKQKEEIEKFERILFYGDAVIKKQEAEIETYLHSIKLLEKDVQTAKFEGIKEFWSRLQEEQEYLIGIDDKFKPYVSVEDGNNLVKEMVGDDNA